MKKSSLRHLSNSQDTHALVMEKQIALRIQATHIVTQLGSYECLSLAQLHIQYPIWDPTG